jgi:hypothetical protein
MSEKEWGKGKQQFQTPLRKARSEKGKKGSWEGAYRREREEMERGGLKETEVAGGGERWRRPLMVKGT